MYVNILYPENERKLFTDREDVLRKLNYALSDVKKGAFRGFVILGVRRCGKTMILKHFLFELLSDSSVIPIYVDFEGMPRDFNIMLDRLIGWIIFWIRTRGIGDPVEYGSPSILIRKLGRDDALLDSVLRFISLTDLDLKFRSILSIINSLDKPVVFILDEIQDFLITAQEAKIDVLGIMREMLRSKTLLVLSGSIRSIMYKVSMDSKERYFLQLETIEIQPFGLKDTWELTEKILGENISGATAAKILRLTGGFPFYIYVITNRARELSELYQIGFDEALDIAYLQETYSSSGIIYEHCRYLWSEYLGYARRKRYLRSILEDLITGPKKISEIAKNVGIDYNTVYIYMEELEKLGIVKRDNNTYYIFNPVFARWIAIRKELPEILRIHPEDKGIITQLKKLEKRVSRAERIASHTFEMLTQRIIAELLGTTIEAGKLGETKLNKVKIPDKIIFNPTIKKENKIYEVDAILENDQRWVVEITLSKIDRKYIQETKNVWKADIYWFITYQGYTKTAKNNIENNEILTDKKHLEKLLKGI